MSAVTILLATMLTAPKTAIPTVSAQTPTVSISKLYNMNETGTTFPVYINVSDATDLNKWRITLTWDPTIIKISEGDPNGIKPMYNTTTYNIYEGGFLKTASNVTYFGVDSVNNDNGWIQSLWGALVGRSSSGSGVLAIINFTLLQKGTTKIEITGASDAFPGKSRLQDSNGDEISHDDIDGVVSDQPPPGPEIWTELWFQITIVVMVVVVLAITYIVYRKKHPEAEKTKETEE
jgi:hypothetical protein